ncbi:MAG: hypothetical protein ABI658_05840 [Acidimicrobiales bacterium]
MDTLAVVMARLLLQTDACPATNPSCAVRPSSVDRKPIFEGFGVHEFLVIGSAALATLVGLIVVAWLLVHLTGAHRDYVQLQPGVAGTGPTRVGGGAGVTLTGGPRRPRPQISPSTWVGVGFVFVLAVGAASWIALRDDDDPVTAATTTTTLRSASTSIVSSATTVAALPANCVKPALTAAFLPGGFGPALVAGLGVTSATDAGCAFHWQGANGVISVLTDGYSPLGPPGNVQVTTQRNGRTMYVGPTPDGGLGIVIEEKELGGAPDIWFTLLSTTVPRNELIETAANLQRG